MSHKMSGIGVRFALIVWNTKSRASFCFTSYIVDFDPPLNYRVIYQMQKLLF